MQTSVSAPINSETIVGQIDVKLGNHLIFSDKIYTIKEVKKDNVASNVKEIIRGFIG